MEREEWAAAAAGQRVAPGSRDRAAGRLEERCDGGPDDGRVCAGEAQEGLCARADRLSLWCSVGETVRSISHCESVAASLLVCLLSNESMNE